jgi:hypothetical protein
LAPFGPAAYLLDLMRVTQVYISDTNTASIPKGLQTVEVVWLQYDWQNQSLCWQNKLLFR